MTFFSKIKLYNIGMKIIILIILIIVFTTDLKFLSNETIMYFINKDYKKNIIYILNDNPTVYIYNTHNDEKYQNKSVVDASNYMKEVLKKNNVDTIVEETNINQVLSLNNWQYSKSYEVSRNELNKLKNQDIKFYIDLHRDSVKKNITTTTINNKKCAKILFVIGLEHENYKENLEVTTKLNDLIKKKYPTLTRGIYKKSGSGVNGIYNQDFDKNVLLLELGGYENTFEEVKNTIDLIVPIISEMVKNE